VLEYSRKSKTRRLAGSKKDLVFVCSLSVSKLRGIVHPGVVDILNFDSFGSLKSCGGGGGTAF